MIELPYEIWLMIVDYLPIHHVRRLYSVNEALFSIALDLRYKEASIAVLPDRVVEETEPPVLRYVIAQLLQYGLLIQLGRNPLLFSRPTALQITFHDSFNHPGPNVTETRIQNRSSWKLILRTIIGSTMGRKPKSIAPTVKLTQITLHAMPRLIHVSTLSFAYAKSLDNMDGRRDMEASLIFPETLRIVGDRLRNLHIQSPFAMYLPPQLGSLESFSVDAVGPCHRPDIHNVMIDKVPAFLLAHQSTIRDVSFSIDNPTLDITPILQCLRDMSCLHTIRLSLSYGTISSGTSVDFQGGREILAKHQQHLTSLSLGFVGDRVIGWAVPVFFRQDWCSVKLPNLRDLTIRLPGVPFRRELGIYIRQFSTSLVSLKIMHVPFSAHIGNGKFRSFCDILSAFPCLEDLSLYLSNFNIEQLIVFASTLPHLRSLLLHYSYQPLQINPVSRL